MSTDKLDDYVCTKCGNDEQSTLLDDGGPCGMTVVCGKCGADSSYCHPKRHLEDARLKELEVVRDTN